MSAAKWSALQPGQLSYIPIQYKASWAHELVWTTGDSTAFKPETVSFPTELYT
jgi:hypothetical protein